MEEQFLLSVENLCDDVNINVVVLEKRAGNRNHIEVVSYGRGLKNCYIKLCDARSFHLWCVVAWIHMQRKHLFLLDQHFRNYVVPYIGHSGGWNQ